ncbi:uncharacterized protein PgNI_09323 [Pyricularia grisea]|uniref:Uncharacterized protein n=1 Tax=Pyricularia grisea TaxID=148305 RepID=A0A6P8ASJ8_PYRGI|nr:uncharacterized protein PgNI_09323 [Pyricularia grisea]TLD05106.1 hypothetical protein PgNI_09323 [Pyricularia grisea]
MDSDVPGGKYLAHAQEKRKREEEKVPVKKSRRTDKRQRIHDSDSDKSWDEDYVPPQREKRSSKPKPDTQSPVPPASDLKTQVSVAGAQNSEQEAPAIQTESPEIIQAREEKPLILDGLLGDINNLAASAAKVVAQVNAMRGDEAQENTQLKSKIENLENRNEELRLDIVRLRKRSLHLYREMQHLRNDAAYGRAMRKVHDEMAGH